MWTYYTQYRYTKKAICVLFCGLLCTELSTLSYHEPNKNNPILPPYFFQRMTISLFSQASQEVRLFVTQDTKFHAHTKWQEQCQFYRWVHAKFWTEWQQVLPDTILLSFPRSWSFSNDIKYLNPDKRQSDRGTSKAMWHKIQTAQHITIRSVQNPFFTVPLFHEYRLPEKPEILKMF
jgi:hypothetical protein